MEALAMEERELLEWSASMGITDATTEESRRAQSSCLGYSLEISTFPEAGGRGLAAVRDLKEGELILVVPKDALFSVESAKGDPHFVKARSCHQDLSSTQVLTVHLLNEVGKGKSSRWYVYLKSLPRCYHTLAQYTELETQALQIEDALWIAERAAEKARKEWEEARPLLQLLGLKLRLTTLKAWLWASATVSSRTLYVPWDNAGTLCPIGDLFNYAPPGAPFKETIEEELLIKRGNKVIFPEVQLHIEKGAFLTNFNQADQLEMHGPEAKNYFELNNDAGSGLHFTDRLTDGGYDGNIRAYCFYARENYSKGDQVLLCYGLYRNLDLLEHYGFVLHENPNDKVDISLHTFRDSMHESVLMWLLKLGPHCSMHIHVDGRPSFHLLAVLRLCYASAGVRKSRGHLAFSGLQICVESDTASYQWLKEICVKLLTSLPTTLDMDTALMYVITMCGSIDGLTGLLELLDASKETDNHNVTCQAGHKLLEDSIPCWSSLSQNSQQLIIKELVHFMQFHKRSQSNRRIQRVKSEGNLRLQRWWLSVQWRLCHKKILHRCVSFCGLQLQFLRHCKIIKQTKGIPGQSFDTCGQKSTSIT